MSRELALKLALAVGLLFIALAYPMVTLIRQAPALSMQFSLYATLAVFLLLAIRNPSASRSVIAFTAWSFRSRRTHGHPGMPQHGGKGRTHRGRCSCDYRCRPNHTRTIEAASGVGVIPSKLHSI